MTQHDRYKDYGQDTFTRSQIIAIRKKEKQKEKIKKTTRVLLNVK